MRLLNVIGTSNHLIQRQNAIGDIAVVGHQAKIMYGRLVSSLTLMVLLNSESMVHCVFSHHFSSTYCLEVISVRAIRLYHGVDDFILWWL